MACWVRTRSAVSGGVGVWGGGSWLAPVLLALASAPVRAATGRCPGRVAGRFRRPYGLRLEGCEELLDLPGMREVAAGARLLECGGQCLSAGGRERVAVVSLGATGA